MSLRSCTGSQGSASIANGKQIGSRAIDTRSPCISVTRPPTSFSSIHMAKSLIRLYRARCKALYPQLEVGDTSLVVPLLQHLERIWGKPDAGLWEFRTPCQHFTHSKVMAWVAFDRGIRMAEEFGTKGPADRWRRLRSRIHKEVCDKGFNKKMKTFTQAYGTRHLDASLLLIPVGRLSRYRRRARHRNGGSHRKASHA